MNRTLAYILVAVVGYLLGSVSTGILVSRAAHGPDLRTVGSGNTGASNVLRTMGFKWAFLVFLGDFLKAFLPGMLGRLLIPDTLYGAMLGGLTAALGHVWPVYFGFRGGKAVSSYAGAAVAVYPVLGLIAMGGWIVLTLVTRYISLASILMAVGFAAAAIALKANGDVLTILWACALMLICLARHKDNIVRLLHGTEHKIGHSGKAGKKD